MISAAQYAQATHAAAYAKRIGFDLDVSSNRFILKPQSGFASILLKDDSYIQYDNLETMLAFLRGWEVLAKHMTSLAGLDVNEVKSRIDQQKVADTLSGKRRRSPKV